MIRPLQATDRDSVVALSVDTGLFTTEEENEQFVGGLDGFLDGSLGADHFWLVSFQEGKLAGAAYYAPDGSHYPSDLAGEGVWNMYFIGVDSKLQRKGVGAGLVAAVEAALTAKAAKALIIETSGTDGFDKIREFYSKLGYEVLGTVPDFYGPGDAKVTYRKKFM